MLVLVLLVSLTASGCRKVMSEQVVEAMGADLLSSISSSDVRVDCPGGITMRAQEDFFCRTSVAGRRGWLLVRQLDDYGRIEFVRELPLDPDVVEPIVERFLRSQYELDADVRCPTGVIQDPDENFRCTVAGHEPVEVRQVDGVDEYSLQWLGADRTGGAG